MVTVRSSVLLVAMLPACFGVSERRETRYVDPDEDGVPWPIDCDDQDAEVGTRVWYLDADGDGLGDALGRVDQCEAPEGAVSVPGDCDDGDPAVYPNAPELCDGLDNDCDGEADEDPAEGEPLVQGFPDEDGDGFGEGDGASWCTLPEGWVTEGGDCDDGAPGVFPGAAVVCGDDVDQDCDGLSDCGRWLEGKLGGEGAVRWVGDAYDRLDGEAMVADLTGDGLVDLLLGSTEVTGSGHGGVYLLPGPLPTSGQHEVEPTAWLLKGDDSQDSTMGTRLRVEDLNFDGVVDLLIAATDGNSDTNRLYLAFGPITGPLDMSGSAATHVLIEGANIRDGFGDGVITGQFDSDGQLDLLVSAPAWASTTKGDNYGALSFFEGPVKNDLSAASPDHRLELFSRASITHAALANLGDIDSDGLDDVAIGLTPWTYNVGTTDYPRDIVAVVTDGAVTSATDIWDAVSWSVIVESVGDDLGVVLVPAGDLDGDGYAELVVGAPGRDVGDDDSGTAWVISGKELNRGGVGYADIEDAAIAQITGNYETDQHVGAALTAPGDLDQDGLGDLLIGAPGYDSDGGAFIVYGPVSGHLQEKDLGALIEGRAIMGADYGAALAAPGDLNALGHPDLLLYAPEKFTWHLLFTDAL